MALQINGKHMDLGESLTNRIQDRIEGAVDKYFGHGYSGRVTMEKSGGEFAADATIHLDSGVVLQATGKAGDATAAFDAASDRLEKRLRRYKRRLKDHHANTDTFQSVDAAYMVIESPEEEEEVGDDFKPIVVAESSTAVKTLTVAMAVLQFDMTDSPVLVFKNAASGQINVIFRRDDGHIGWVDPARSADST
jgi:ribosomal subunit interface protein